MVKCRRKDSDRLYTFWINHLRETRRDAEAERERAMRRNGEWNDKITYVRTNTISTPFSAIILVRCFFLLIPLAAKALLDILNDMKCKVRCVQCAHTHRKKANEFINFSHLMPNLKFVSRTASKRIVIESKIAGVSIVRHAPRAHGLAYRNGAHVSALCGPHPH